MGKLFQPRRIARLDELSELIPVALGVHAGPETGMLVDVQFSVACELHQRLAFEDAAFILRQAFQKIPVEEKIATIDPMAFEVGLLGELDDAVAVHFDLAKREGGLTPSTVPSFFCARW